MTGTTTATEACTLVAVVAAAVVWNVISRREHAAQLERCEMLIKQHQ
jgi:hypothetical protein